LVRSHTSTTLNTVFEIRVNFFVLGFLPLLVPEQNILRPVEQYRRSTKCDCVSFKSL